MNYKCIICLIIQIVFNYSADCQEIENKLYESDQKLGVLSSRNSTDSLVINIWFDVANPVASVLEYKMKNNLEESLTIYCYTHKGKRKSKQLIKKAFNLAIDSSLIALIKQIPMKCSDMQGVSCSGLDGTRFIFEFINKNQIEIRSYWSPFDQIQKNNELNFDIINHINCLKNGIKLDRYLDEFYKLLPKGYYMNEGPMMIYIRKKRK